MAKKHHVENYDHLQEFFNPKYEKNEHVWKEKPLSTWANKFFTVTDLGKTASHPVHKEAKNGGILEGIKAVPKRLMTAEQSGKKAV